MHIYQPLRANGKPRRESFRKPPWRIAVIANLKDEFEPEDDDPPDAGAEFDRWDTINAIVSALEAEGHFVHFCAGDYTLPEALANLRPHICFNIAEGLMGDGREAQVPALLELMGIPYTASRVVANAISLDKTLTKRIWRDSGLPTAHFWEFVTLPDFNQASFDYPLFVKPSREGTGMGINGGAIVHNDKELAARITWVLEAYKQPALVESFLPGREFTVGFIGNPGDPSQRPHPEIYDSEGYHWFPILELDTHTTSTPGVYGYDAKSLALDDDWAPRYLCPANISPDLHSTLVDLTKRAAEALQVSDVARVDFRLDADGYPHLLEINTLPGLNPSISDLCIMADAEGLPYQTVITEILYLAAARFGLPFDHQDVAAFANLPIPLGLAVPLPHHEEAIPVSSKSNRNSEMARA